MTVKNASPATKEDVEKIVTKVSIGFSEAILEGVQKMFDEQNKVNTQTFATKEDLKREISWLKDDIKGLTADLSDTASKKEFNSLKSKVDKHVSRVVS
ncbi:MAG: hypothetical protein UU16_C0003G0007 [Candidatus Woesebacteria bacterium GW2011_GWA2_40_7]|uniref:Uncharacterized protein n=3 Tax=Candidatus Woeseibacteriota TaxID=1752722 RepID=A0A0G0UYN3_9BACT|nr:MAG: hypothetical protein UT17_C0002G0028 [Candidatus Woesebacteria bacterium GW2011_GWB1_39_10]KKR74246.1 MAG: hypothetical protein UU16_C0003G0007 [Candidatus Woesebacteria bacterium GW2011_GWA2_40_7]KKR92621.1 MAG: hypothetical protein UU42_C0001G0225 [Candidatus Woesebacteria bacterium GW2011_GWA1_41_13b]